MFTLFGIPKPFRGKAAVAQRNAIQSWKFLHPDVEIILFGDDEGIKEACDEFGLKHEGNIPVWESGTKAPFEHEIWRRASLLARHSLICHACSDMILTSDLINAVNMVSSFDRFFLVGRRYDLAIDEPVDFKDPEWEIHIKQQPIKLTPTKGLDYYVYPADLFGEIPPYITGRPYMDNWLVYRALQLNVPIIDATETVLVVHQTHEINGRGHTKEETRWNRRLAGAGVSFNTDDSTHLLTQAGVKVRPSTLHSLDSKLILKSPGLYRILTLADYRRTGYLRHLLFAPWRILRRTFNNLFSLFG